MNVIAADSDTEAEHLLTSLQQVFVQLRRGRPGPMPPPRADFQEQLTGEERATLAHVLACTFAGAPATIAETLRAFVDRTAADELIVSAHIHDHQARLKSLSLTAQLRD